MKTNLKLMATANGNPGWLRSGEMGYLGADLSAGAGGFGFSCRGRCEAPVATERGAVPIFHAQHMLWIVTLKC